MQIRKRTRKKSFGNERGRSSSRLWSGGSLVPSLVVCSWTFFHCSSILAFYHQTPAPTNHLFTSQNQRFLKISSLFISQVDVVVPEFGKSPPREDPDSSSLVLSNTTSPASPSLPTPVLPPWLEQYQHCQPDQVATEIQWLEEALMERHGFSSRDATDVVKAIYLASRGEIPTIVGCVDFCRLLLGLEDDTATASKKTKTTTNYFVTKDVILASVLHYTECVMARFEGIYERLDLAVGASGAAVALGNKNNNHNGSTRPRSLAQQTSAEYSESTSLVWMDPSANSDFFLSSSASLRYRLSLAAEKSSDFFNIFSVEALRLAESASKIKRAEILAHVILRNGRRLNRDSYGDMRNLLVSLSDDWRALAIRCVASLYRLDGVVQSIPHGTGEFVMHKSQDATMNAKDSLRVYASLAQRLGLHRLKLQLETSAFRLLYPRQYSAASTLFQEHGAGMKAISNFLSNQLKQLLIEDSSLMYELEDLQVVARVKEPYSFWKKLLKKRLDPLAQESSSFVRRTGSRSSWYPVRSSKELSVMEINDGVALRVILKARKMNAQESDETTRARERILCYYVQSIVRSQWPEVNSFRVKDYIRFPKANGYQSLHHTSKITRNGQNFFFEIQIRSEEMHQLAEFGVAAHWTYKLDTKHPSLSLSSSGNDVSSTDGVSSEPHPALIENQSSGDSNSSEVESSGSIAEAESASYIHALEESRRSLMQSYVYVFLAGSSSLETGQLLTLSAGSLVMDVLKLLRQEDDLDLVDTKLKIWKNGKLAFLEESVRNGDMLLIEKVIQSAEIGGGSSPAMMVS